MLRNREIRYLLLIMCIISIIAMITASLISISALITVFVTSSLLIGCCFYFTYWRYREIEKLSSYLRRISAGEDSLDIRDNQEGELSILKNDIYKVTLRLTEQRLYLQEDKRQLTNAISDISHQLKTPLTSMTVMADLLVEADLSEERKREFIGNIQVQLDRLDWLVSSLLKLAKIDAGTVEFKKEPIRVKTLIEKALEPMLIPMDIKAQTLTISGDQATTFIGDFHWAREALINILKNCVEHTREGGHINITYSENVLFSEIIIADNGKGISKQDIPYIFKRFYKGKNASDESVGIGLAMAHSIVASQNGAIDVTSVEGKGTQFHIKFYKQMI